MSKKIEDTVGHKSKILRIHFVLLFFRNLEYNFEAKSMPQVYKLQKRVERYLKFNFLNIKKFVDKKQNRVTENAENFRTA